MPALTSLLRQSTWSHGDATAAFRCRGAKDVARALDNEHMFAAPPLKRPQPGPCAPDAASTDGSSPTRRRASALRALVACSAALLLTSGCSTTPTEWANRLLPSTPIIPDYSLPVSPSLSIPLEAMVAAALVYWFVDPLGPNWEVAERRVSPTLVQLSMRKKRIATGGDGEPSQIVRRRATELALQAGFRGYQILDYVESTESETIGARRMTTVLLKLTDERPLRIP